MSKCPRCSGFVRAEPARLVCLICGWDAYPAVGPAARLAQAALDRSLRSRSAESRARPAPRGARRSSTSSGSPAAGREL